MTTIQTNQLTVGYDKKNIIKNLSLAIPEGKITALIGPNGSGKSTLLKALARILPPTDGEVLLDGQSIQQQPTKEVAKKIALLPQNSDPSLSLTVAELVSYGRFPYQKGFSGLQKEDYRLMDWALAATGVTHLRERNIQSLSGGQRQRAWIAMALAQDTDILILDEPTTFLDPAHQLEVMTLLEMVNQEQGKTILLSIHDLNHASRFADCIFALKAGELVAAGTPEKVLTADNLALLYDIDATLTNFPESSKPLILTYELRGKQHEG